MKYSVSGSNEIFKNKEIKTFKTLSQAQAFIQKDSTRKKWHDLKIWEVLM